MRLARPLPGLLLLLGGPAAEAQVTTDVPAVLPAAVVDLRSSAGARLVGARWRYSDVKIVEVAHREPGPDLGASGPPNRTYDITPHAGAGDFDDSAWPEIEPAALEARRSHGRLAFNWYRTGITLPARVGGLDVTGATVIFELVVDDYAEIWVDGRLLAVLGQTGGQLVKGFNAPNRVVLTTDARPGQRFQLAIFGINGPVSSPPANFIWIRSATLDFYPPGRAGGARDAVGRIVRLDPAVDEIIPRDARLEKLAGGFQFIEGPVWHPDGYLPFSDPNANTIYRWARQGSVSEYRSKSGYAGVDIGEYRQPGSNGLTLDRDGLLVIAEHGNRRVVRLERPGKITVLADRYDGKRLNSPNDLVYRSDGSLYFTDPPFGLPGAFDDPDRELDHQGVYRLGPDGSLVLLTAELRAPNGLAFSPDERTLYIPNADAERLVWMAYPVRPDGALGEGRVFFDGTTAFAGRRGTADGLEVDAEGNLFAVGPGGVYVFAPDASLLGWMDLAGNVGNVAWGEDGATLFVTANSAVYRARLATRGAGWSGPPAARLRTGSR